MSYYSNHTFIYFGLFKEWRKLYTNDITMTIDFNYRYNLRTKEIQSSLICCHKLFQRIEVVGLEFPRKILEIGLSKFNLVITVGTQREIS